MLSAVALQHDCCLLLALPVSVCSYTSTVNDKSVSTRHSATVSRQNLVQWWCRRFVVHSRTQSTIKTRLWHLCQNLTDTGHSNDTIHCVQMVHTAQRLAIDTVLLRWSSCSKSTMSTCQLNNGCSWIESTCVNQQARVFIVNTNGGNNSHECTTDKRIKNGLFHDNDASVVDCKKLSSTDKRDSVARRARQISLIPRGPME